MAECQKKKQLLMTECRKYLFTNGSKSTIFIYARVKNFKSELYKV